MTLEEMTRRRDGWRQRFEVADQARRVAEQHAIRCEQRAIAAEQERDAVVSTEQVTSRELLAAQREAPRYATECGRLVDELMKRHSPAVPTTPERSEMMW